MTKKIHITITAEERDELLNALYFTFATIEQNLTTQELNTMNCLIGMLEQADE